MDSREVAIYRRFGDTADALLRRRDRQRRRILDHRWSMTMPALVLEEMERRYDSLDRANLRRADRQLAALRLCPQGRLV